ncbi:recombinase family protein [Bdellovibrio sp. HCB117]|uniref:recombinase family protein n=1 Tax=Bdellovibrio sp. HCB117 TaxID=3394359 RepID=UPI0039B49708
MDKRIAIYLRVSTQGQNTELQVAEIQSFLAARGWRNYQVYEDKCTGTTATRPALKELLKNARLRRHDIIVCWKMDRLFRSLKDLVGTLQEFDELGIEFISLKDSIDMTTASGRLMTHLLAAFAEFEASLINERVMAGLENARRKGKILGRPKIINSEQVLLLRGQGLSLSQIAERLKVTKSAVSKTLKKSTLQTIENTKPEFLKTTVEKTLVLETPDRSGNQSALT